MGFRDESEALRSRIESLESELGETKATIARLKGSDEALDLDAVPPRPSGWKRRVRRFRGTLNESDYEQLARLLSAKTQQVTGTGRAGGLFTLTSLSERWIVMPGEADELILLFDEQDYKLRQVLTPICLSVVLFGLGDKNSTLVVRLIVAAVAALSIVALYVGSIHLEKKRFAKGDELFGAVGEQIERATRSRAPAAEVHLEEGEPAPPKKRVMEA